MAHLSSGMFPQNPMGAFPQMAGLQNIFNRTAGFQGFPGFQGQAISPNIFSLLGKGVPLTPQLQQSLMGRNIFSMASRPGGFSGLGVPFSPSAIGGIGGGGGGGGGGGAPPQYTVGFNPSLFGQYAGFLPPSGSSLQGAGIPGLGADVRTSLNRLTGLRETQLADYLSSIGLQRELTPLQSQLDLDLAGQFVPQQLAQQAGFRQLEAGLLAQDPLLGPQMQSFLGAQGGALSGLGALPGLDQNFMAAQSGINELLTGKLPEGVSEELQDVLGSTAAQFNLGDSPAAFRDVSRVLGSNLGQIRSNLLGSYGNIAGQLTAQRSARLSDVFGATQLGIPGAGSLLQFTGIPDIGFGPIGFGGASGIFSGSLETLAQQSAQKQARRQGYLDIAAGIFEGAAKAAGGLFG